MGLTKMNNYDEEYIGNNEEIKDGIKFYYSDEEDDDNLNNDQEYIMGKIAEEYLKCLEKIYNKKEQKIQLILQEEADELVKSASEEINPVNQKHSVNYLSRAFKKFRDTYILNSSNINIEAMQEALKNLLDNNIITSKFFKSITSYSLQRVYALYQKYDYMQPNNSSGFESLAAVILYMSLNEKNMLDLSNYYLDYTKKLLSIALPLKEESQKPQKIDYSEIKKTIINEYKKELVSEYNSIVSQKMALNERYNIATSTIRDFNEALAEKGINARIQYSYNIRFGIPIAIAVIFNNLLGIPLKDEYEDYTDCNDLILNPIGNIKKLMLLYKLRTMTDEEWELLRRGIKEHEDNNDILIKIGELEEEQDEYLKNYIYNRFNINHNILVKVVYKLYNEGIITDEFLHSPQVISNELLGTRDDIYISNSNEITSTPAHLAKFINYLENNMAYDSDFLSSNISINSNTEEATIINQRTISLPRTRIIL